jgi:hypothetical protein
MLLQAWCITSHPKTCSHPLALLCARSPVQSRRACEHMLPQAVCVTSKVSKLDACLNQLNMLVMPDSPTVMLPWDA